MFQIIHIVSVGLSFQVQKLLVSKFGFSQFNNYITFILTTIVKMFNSNTVEYFDIINNQYILIPILILNIFFFLLMSMIERHLIEIITGKLVEAMRAETAKVSSLICW